MDEKIEPLSSGCRVLSNYVFNSFISFFFKSRSRRSIYLI